MQPTTEQLALINSKFARVPLAADRVYVFPTKVIGNNLIPKYNMRLTPNFLSKMAEQVKGGIALLIDHPWQKWEATAINYGRSFNGLLQTDGDELALYADYYMVLGQEFEGIKTDSLASAIDSGTIFDTSAGFVTTKCLCNICNTSYWSGSCPHFNGRTYEIEGKDVVCELIGDDGYIMENSLVFDGAYEGAGIPLGRVNSSTDDSPQRYTPWNLADKTPPPDGRLYCTFSAAGGMNVFVASAQPTQGGSPPTAALSTTQSIEGTEKDMEQATILLTQIRAALGVQTDTDIMTSINALNAKAKIADDYKSELIDSACGSGVRALGEAFNVEVMKTSLANLSIEQVKALGKTYETQAQVVLGGGRKTIGANLDALPVDPTLNPNGDDEDMTDEDYSAAAKASLARVNGEV